MKQKQELQWALFPEGLPIAAKNASLNPPMCLYSKNLRLFMRASVRWRPRRDNFKPLECDEEPCLRRMWRDEEGLGQSGTEFGLPKVVERSLFRV